MSDKDRLVDGLHSVLVELWEGSDEMAATEFRKLLGWSARAAKPSTETWKGGTFPGPALKEAPDREFLELATGGMHRIEAAFNTGNSQATTQCVKDLLSTLSERRAQ